MQTGSRTEAVGMNSSEGEFVQFKKMLLLEGQVEFWLKEVEKTMQCVFLNSLRNNVLVLVNYRVE